MAPRLMLAALATGLALLASMPGDGATPPHASVELVDGSFSHSNSLAGSAILTATDIRPGESASGTVVIENDGTLPGDFTLAKSDLADAPGPNGGQLSDKLDLEVADVSDPAAPVAVYSGKLGAMGARDLGTFAAGERRTYRFTVTFPDGGLPGSETGGDNAYKGSALSVQYDWTSTGEGAAPPDGDSGEDPSDGGNSGEDPTAPPGDGGGEADPGGDDGVQPDPAGDGGGQPDPAPAPIVAPPPPLPPPTDGTGAPSPPAADTTPPRIVLRGRKTQKLGKKRRLRLKVACDEPCALRASWKSPGAKRRTTPAGTPPLLVYEPAKPRRLTMKLSKRQAKAAKRAMKRRKKAVVKVTVRAVDAAGNSAKARRKIKLKK